MFFKFHSRLCINFFSIKLLVCLALFINSINIYSETFELVWAEEFNYTGLPKSENWNFEVGYVRNFESQFYTSGMKENSYVNNGYLTIVAMRNQKKEVCMLEQKNRNYLAKLNNYNSKIISDCPYTSASLTTKGLHSWQYGVFEVRASLPNGKGVWPAIWTLGANINDVGWPKSGEIDIMEYVGKSPGQFSSGLHYWNYSLNRKNKKTSVKKQSDSLQEFHIYKMVWTKESIEFFFDDISAHKFEFNKDFGSNHVHPFRKPHFLILNLALGGKWGGDIDDNILPATFVVDYVRIYQNTSEVNDTTEN